MSTLLHPGDSKGSSWGPASEPAGRETLASRLRIFHHRALWVGLAAGLGWGIVIGIFLVLSAMWLDLLWELSPQGRITSLITGLAAAVVAVIVIFWKAHRRASPRGLAQQLDRLAETGGQVLSGLELSAQQSRLTGVEHGLALLAVQRAQRWAQQATSSAVVPTEPIRRSLLVLAAILTGVVGVMLLAPRLAHTQWARFTMPFADIPPYARVQFDVQPGNTEVIYGSGLEIYATPTGPSVDRVELVLRSTMDGHEESLPLFQESSGRWRTVIGRIVDPTEYFVRSGRARSMRFQIGVITLPRLESVRFRITPPVYTRQGPYEGPLPKEGLVGLPGTKVDVWATSNRPLGGGEMLITIDRSQKTVALRPEVPSAETVQGDFLIDEAGTFRLHVIDVEQQASVDTLSGSISLLQDHRPFVRLLQPRAISYAVPTTALPVVISAEDDYGISRLQLFRSLNGSRATPLDIEVSETPRNISEQVILPLSRYDLQAGDEIRLFARVEDNAPAGAKGSESPVVIIRIISQEEYERMVQTRQGLQELTKKYQEAERRLAAVRESTRELKEKAGEAEEFSEELAQALQDHAANLQKQASAIEKLAKRRLPLDVEECFNTHLERLASMLDAQAKMTTELARQTQNPTSNLAATLDEMLKALEDDQQKFNERVAEPLAYLEQVYPLIEDQARFVEIARQQASLAQRLQSLKGHDAEDDPHTKRRMRDLEEEQQKLRGELVRLLEDIEEHLLKLPEDESVDDLRKSAAEFVREIRSSSALPTMAEAELGLSEFSGSKGHAKAQEAAEILASFISKCSSSADEGNMACQLRFRPKDGAGDGQSDLGQTIPQLLSQAGFGMGEGGSGYSAQRNSLQNVGIYGETIGQDVLSESGAERNAVLTRAADELRKQANPSVDVTAPSASRAVGGVNSAVPASYRSRVGEYFRRIADELNR